MEKGPVRLHHGQQTQRQVVHRRHQRPGKAGEAPSECHFVIPAKAGIHDDNYALEKAPFVYIMASKRNGTLYTGVTSDLVKRVWEHREGRVEGFTKRYGVKRLVYFEAHGDMYAAITRERQIKEWHRRWKLELIEGMNPGWVDLWETIVG